MRLYFWIKMTALSFCLLVQIGCAEINASNNQHTVELHLNKTLLETYQGVFNASSSARILALGEQTHGAGTVFQFKTDYIKWLHQHHGLELLALESGMFDVYRLMERMRTGESLAEIAPGSIFYMYANSQEVRDLLAYIQDTQSTERPLKLVGFDSQHTGEMALDYLVAELKLQSETEAVWSSEVDWLLIQKVLENKSFADGEKQRLLQGLGAMASSFDRSGNGFWQRIVLGLVAQAKRQWGEQDQRSYEMGRNVAWWASQYPQDRMVVWAHSVHLMKKGYQGVNAGEYLSKTFGNQYYVLHFTGLSGSYINFIDMQVASVAALESNSIEYGMSEQGKFDQHFLNLSSPLPWSGYSMWAVDYRQSVAESSWRKFYDGTVVFNQVSPATYKE